MKPQKQPIPINFAGGIDTKTDPWQVAASKFLSLNNMVFTKGGRLSKRNGFGTKGKNIISQLSYSFQAFSSAITTGSFTNTYQNELVMGDGMNAYSYSIADDNWIYKGRLESNRITTSPVYQNQYTQILADSAINSSVGHTLYAWEQWTRIPDLGGTYNGVYFSIFDNTTGLEIAQYNIANTNSRPKCVSIGTNLYMVYFDGTNLKAIGVTESTTTGPFTLASNIDTTLPNYDLQVIGSNLYVAYNGTSSTVKVASFNSSLTPIANVSKSESATNGIGLFPDSSNNVWVAYNNGSATKAFIMDSALSVTVLAPTVVDSGSTAANVKNVTGCYDGTRGIILYDQQGVPALGQISGVETDANYVQPAVGSSVIVSFDVDPLQYLGQIIFIPTGGYYYASGYVSGDLALTNLGYAGNATPGTTITAPQILYPVWGNINADITYNTLTVGGSAGTPAIFIKSAALNSRAFVKNNIAHVVASYDSPIQPSYFLCALYNISAVAQVQIANISGKIFENESGGIPYKSILPSVNLDANSAYNVALPKRIYSIAKTEASTQVLTWFNGIFNVNLDLNPTEVSSQELGKTLIVANGSTMMYDGQTVVEQGFHIFPENVTGAVSVAAASQLSTGLYGYQVVYQWIDANGQIYQSAPSPVLSVSVTAGSQITLTIPTLRISGKGDVTIAIYRTQANDSVYFRLDTERFNAYPINSSLIANTITIADGTADSQIVGNEQLYTLGEIENIAPPCTSVITNFKERAVLFPSDNRNSFWYSKQIVPGSPVEFNDTFVQNVNTVGGNLITGAPMDDKLVLYKQASVYYMIGSGPAASGANNDFSEPILVTTDCGAVDINSIVPMPMGHMFKSEKGIYLLDRSLNAQYIGADVESYNQYNVLTAKLIPGTTQVRFSLSSGDVLMFDYFYNQWAVFPALNSISDCLFQRKHTFLRSDGTIYQETPSQYLDGILPVLMSFATSWIKLAGLQGYQRAYFCYILGNYISAHQLQLSLYSNFSSTPDQTNTITPDASDFLENWRLFFTDQRCQSFQVALQEVYGGTPGAAFTLSGLNLIAGMKSPFRTISSAQSVG